MTGHFLYVFLGEGGNFDFTAGGTPYFLFSSIAKERPFAAYQDMTELKYDLIETGANIEYFHAAEDAQATRNRVFDIIERRLQGIRIDSLIIEKRKTGPALQHPESSTQRCWAMCFDMSWSAITSIDIRKSSFLPTESPWLRSVMQSKKPSE
jgi:hypothetical protein